MRTTILSWLRTRAASSRLAQTTLNAPTRSPYSEKLLENEVDTKKSIAGIEEHADDRAVLGEAVSEALVGHVEERHQPATLHGLDHLRPLRCAERS